MVIDVIDVHCLNAASPKELRLLGRDMTVSLSHFSNAWEPMDVMDDGMLIDVILLPMKA